MKTKLEYLLESRKFWAAFIGLLITLLTHFVPNFPIAEDQLLEIALIVVSFILGTALEDGLSRINLK